jgi:hypothetical protein
MRYATSSIAGRGEIIEAVRAFDGNLTWMGNHVTDNVSNLEVSRHVTYSLRMFSDRHFCELIVQSEAIGYLVARPRRTGELSASARSRCEGLMPVCD